MRDKPLFEVEIEFARYAIVEEVVVMLCLIDHFQRTDAQLCRKCVANDFSKKT